MLDWLFGNQDVVMAIPLALLLAGASAGAGLLSSFKGGRKALLGSTDDTARTAREQLLQFGKGEGDLFGQLQGQGLSLAQLVGSNQRTASGQQLARSGLAGTGIGFDVLQDASLTEAEALRRFRLGLLQQQIRALGGAASGQQQRTPGLIEGLSPLASAFLLRDKG